MINTSFRSRLATAPAMVLSAGLLALGIGASVRATDVGNPSVSAPLVAQAVPGTATLAALPAITVEDERTQVADQVAETVASDLDRLAALAPTLDRKVLKLALAARDEAVRRGEARRAELLTVIDYSLPSTDERMWVFDTQAGELLFHELVAHGKNTGEKYAERFSNRDGSLQTSLGTFVTAGTYQGGNGYSLQLEGLDEGWNDNAMTRYIVMHGAPYVSKDFVRSQGRIGRSWGCPAVSQQVAGKVIDTIKGGSVVFSFFPDEDFITSSRYVAAAAEEMFPATGGTMTALAR
jgi:hypothetical protein